MDTQTFLNIGLVLVFVLVGGFFAAAEIALVSLRDSQVDALDERGTGAARGSAARRRRDPNRFLAAVQVGVTLAGFFSAAFGGVDAAPRPRARASSDLGLSEGAADHGAGRASPSPSPTSRWSSASWSPSGWRCSARRASRWSSRPTLDRIATVSARSSGCCRCRPTPSCGCSAATRTRRASRSTDEELRDLVADARRPRRARSAGSSSDVFERRRPPAPRGDDPAHRGRLPRRARRRSPRPRRTRREQPALALPGDRRRRRRRRRLRARPRPARRRRRPAASLRVGELARPVLHAAGHQAGAGGADRDARARARTSPSSSTSTAAPPASSRSRTSSRSSSATSSDEYDVADAHVGARPRRIDGLLNLDDFEGEHRHRAARGPLRDRRRLRHAASSATSPGPGSTSRSPVAPSRSPRSSATGSPDGTLHREE